MVGESHMNWRQQADLINEDPTHSDVSSQKAIGGQCEY
jgi:hypothetical protein